MRACQYSWMTWKHNRVWLCINVIDTPGMCMTVFKSVWFLVDNCHSFLTAHVSCNMCGFKSQTTFLYHDCETYWNVWFFHLGRGPAISGHNEQLWAPTSNWFSHNCTKAREAPSLTHILLQKCILFEDQNATVSFLMTIMYACSLWGAASILWYTRTGTQRARMSVYQLL